MIEPNHWVFCLVGSKILLLTLYCCGVIIGELKKFGDKNGKEYGQQTYCSKACTRQS